MVRKFLTKELQLPFPRINLSLRYGESYHKRLEELGVPERSIEGSHGMYIGNRFSAHIIIDLQEAKEFILEGNIPGAVLSICHVAIEEFTHALAPRISDRDISDKIIALMEKFLPDFKFNYEQKRMINDSLAGEPKDGLFFPEY